MLNEAPVGTTVGGAADASTTHSDCVRIVKQALEGLPAGEGPDHTLGMRPATATELVYGELTWVGMQTLHDVLKLRADDHLYDLGSGVGKFVLYAALRNECASCTGVEVGIKRHSSAERGCARLAALLGNAPAPAPQPDGGNCSESPPSKRSHMRARLSAALKGGAAVDVPSTMTQFARTDKCAAVSAILGDITDIACSYRDATVVVLCNIMFGSGINGRVLDNLLNRCPRVRLVASIVQMHHPRLRQVRSVLVPCTWCAKGVSWLLYEMLAKPEKMDLRLSGPHWLGAPALPAPKWVRPKTVADVGATHPPAPPRPPAEGALGGGYGAEKLRFATTLVSRQGWGRQTQRLESDDDLKTTFERLARGPRLTADERRQRIASRARQQPGESAIVDRIRRAQEFSSRCAESCAESDIQTLLAA